MFYLDYILYPLLIILACILIQIRFKPHQEGFNHRGGEELARGKKDQDIPPGVFDFIIYVINAIYQFLLIFSRILTAPSDIVRFFTNIVSSIRSTFTTIYTVCSNLLILLNELTGDLMTILYDSVGDKIGLDNYDLGAPAKFIKSLAKS
jgi:hypothetical protein